jgi:hypothetical protein
MTIDPVARTTGAALALAPMRPEARTDRDARAVRYLTSRGCEDLLEVLGLADDERPGGGPRSVTCPTCEAVPGASCNKQYQEGTTKRYHRSRYRLVGDERA